MPLRAAPSHCILLFLRTGAGMKKKRHQDPDKTSPIHFRSRPFVLFLLANWTAPDPSGLLRSILSNFAHGVPASHTKRLGPRARIPHLALSSSVYGRLHKIPIEDDVRRWT
ncbi:hypothetical protein IWZ00DRAFT_493214 [Phyllosticta capitalensis]